MSSVVNWLTQWSNVILGTLSTILPISPLISFVNTSMKVPLLALINYFIPLSAYIAICEIWAIAVLAWRGKSILLKWIKLVS